MKFYNRESELKNLSLFKERSFSYAQMTVMVGRRRTGKTSLIRKSIEVDTTAVYLFVAKKSEKLLCSEFLELIQYQLKEHPHGEISQFSQVFSWLMDISKARQFTLVIDEFQEFLTINPSIMSEMQNIWDSKKEGSQINLILCGSIYSLMKRIFENSKEPLFSRATARMHIKPFQINVLKEILQDHVNLKSDKNLFPFYIFTGGVAKYVENLIMTEASICVLTEGVGRTLRDIPSLCLSKYTPAEHKYIFTNIEVYKRLIFDYLYSIHCMTSLCGIIHGDLHMNNVTVNHLYSYLENGVMRLKQPSISYKLGGHNYVLTHYGLFGTIIDFSRGIHCDKFTTFGEALPFDFYERQVPRIISTINTNFPQFYSENKNKIVGNIIMNLPEVFKLMSTLDAYNLINNMKSRLASDTAFKEIPPPKEIIEFTNRAVEVISKITIDNIMKLGQECSGDNSSLTQFPQWPMEGIIHQLYSDYILDGPEYSKRGLMDVFSYDYPMKVNLSDYYSWNDIMRWDRIWEIEKEVYGDQAGMDLKQRFVQFVTDPVDETDDLIAMEARSKETERVEYPAWMFY